MNNDQSLSASVAGRRNHPVVSDIFLNNSNDVIYLAECRDRRFLTYNMLFVSSQAKNIFGYDPDEFIRDSGLWVKTIHREDLPTVMEFVSRTLDTGKQYTYQYRIRPKNSEEYIWVEDTIAPLRNQALRNGIQGALRNIHERKRMELHLKENEEKYRSLFEKVSDAIILIDAGTHEIREVNRAFVKTYGYSPDEASAMKMTDLTSEGGSKMTPDALGRNIMGSGDQAATFWHRKKDGTVFPVEITTGTFNLKGRRMICAISRDISERKEFEMKLQESENKFRDLAEKSVVGIYLIQDDLLMYANPMLARIFGYSIDEITGRKGPVDLVLPEDWPVVKEYLQKRFSGEIESAHYEFRGITKDRRTIFLEAYGSATILHGKPAVIGTLLDITERKQAEEERERLIIDHLDALSRIKTLSGLLPICASCKKIRDDKGYWKQIESYISEHSDALFSHGICPDCAKNYYPGLFKEDGSRNTTQE